MKLPVDDVIFYSLASIFSAVAVFRTQWVAYLLTYGRPETAPRGLYVMMRLWGGLMGLTSLVYLIVIFAQAAWSGS